jgi:hypothetical protein
MCDQIDAQMRADKSALNATSAEGKIGGRIGTDGKLLKKAKKEKRKQTPKVVEIPTNPHFRLKLEPVPVLVGLMLSFRFFIVSQKFAKVDFHLTNNFLFFSLEAEIVHRVLKMLYSLCVGEWSVRIECTNIRDKSLFMQLFN